MAILEEPEGVVEAQVDRGRADLIGRERVDLIVPASISRTITSWVNTPIVSPLAGRGQQAVLRL